MRISKAFISSDKNHPGLSSYDLSKMNINPNGSVDFHFGKEAPKVKETN